MVGPLNKTRFEWIQYWNRFEYANMPKLAVIDARHYLAECPFITMMKAVDVEPTKPHDGLVAAANFLRDTSWWYRTDHLIGLKIRGSARVNTQHIADGVLGYLLCERDEMHGEFEAR
jgi:hypothetical protein